MNKELCFECHSQEGRHKMDCGSKAVFDAYILLRDTDKWKYFTESMLNTLEFKVWTEQQDRKYSNKFYMRRNKKTWIDYYQLLADSLPDDLNNKELLYQKYQEYIKTIEQEEEYE